VNIFLYSIPAFFDLISSGLNYVSISFTSGSISNMMQVTSIIWTAVFSKIFLKKDIYRHHFLGIILISIGV